MEGGGFSGGNGGKWQREYITPHRLALLVVINKVCLVKRHLNDPKDCPYTPETIRKMIREFSIAVLHLIQASDIEPQDFLSAITKFLPEKTLDDCILRLTNMYRVGVAALMDCVMTLDKPSRNPTPDADVNKSSVLGLFICRMILAFDKLTFSDVTDIYRSYQKYYLAMMTSDQMTTSQVDPGVFPEGNVSACTHRQAELFVARQGALLVANETEALPPKCLHRRMKSLLREDPGFAEAHFLNYLNSLRLKEYRDAVHSIHHCFDCGVNGTNAKGPASEDASRNFRFAALNLTILLHTFGHTKEAEESLSDAIRMAQDASDHICLQHALSWLCRLSQSDDLVERSIAKSSELGLPHLTSIGILKYSQGRTWSGHKPTEVFEFMSKSDVLNCQHSMLDLTCASYGQKAHLWEIYGKRGMSSLCAQLLLNLNTSSPSLNGVHLSTEAHCLARCRIARLLAEEGDYGSALTVIEGTARQFPQLISHSRHWMIEESGIRFRRALLRGRWAEAESAVESLAAFSGPASDFSHAELLAHKGNLSESHAVVRRILATESVKVDNWNYYRVRLLLLACDIHCQAGDFAFALAPALQAIALCRKQHFSYLEALATAHLANVKLHLGEPNVARKLICDRMQILLSHGPPYDRHRVTFLYHKCRIQAVRSSFSNQRDHPVLVDAARSLTSVAEGFRKIEAFHRAKEVFHAQAVLCHELGLREECNEAAFKFRIADLQCNATATIRWRGRL